MHKYIHEITHAHIHNICTIHIHIHRPIQTYMRIRKEEFF